VADKRGAVLATLMMCVGLAAIDATVVATAVPSIVDDLGGFADFPWLFSVYLLAQGASVPVYGRLADVYGRKPLLLIGLGLFLAGSLLCGFAWSMTSLIVSRAVLGLGAGALQPISLTIAADLYPVAERGRVQGYFGSVWATSSLLGPAVGGLVSEHVGWRWIFFANVPLCLLAVLMLRRGFTERVEARPARFDALGAALLAGGFTLLTLGLLEGGQAWPWYSPVSLAVLGGGLVLLLVFAGVETRVREPVLPAWLFRRRNLVASNLVALCVGAVLFGLTSYVPTFAQGVLGVNATTAGFALTALTLAWAASASQSSRLYLRIGFRATSLIGSGVTVAGGALMATVRAGSTVFFVSATCLVIGAGLGLVNAPTIIAAQASVGWSERGVVTGANLFSRSIGSAIGVAGFGAVANTILGGQDPPPAAALARAAHGVFLLVAVVTVLMALSVVALPRHASRPGG
jgi:EmrB/QacA subfamily drug resistance transporter